MTPLDVRDWEDFRAAPVPEPSDTAAPLAPTPEEAPTAARSPRLRALQARERDAEAIRGMGIDGCDIAANLYICGYTLASDRQLRVRVIVNGRTCRAISADVMTAPSEAHGAAKAWLDGREP